MTRKADEILNEKGQTVDPILERAEWLTYLASSAGASEEFMDGVEDLSVQERGFHSDRDATGPEELLGRV